MINKMNICLLALAGFVCLAYAAPLLGLEDESLDDTAIVESTIREVRATKDSEYSPSKWEKHYDSGDKGDIGYTRQKSDKGKTGYQKFDSFHKKGGDSYGYEKHDSFGLKDKKSSGGNSGKASYTQKEGDGKAAKYQEAPESSYEVTEEQAADDVSDESPAYEGGEVSVTYDDEAEDDGSSEGDDSNEEVSEGEAAIQVSGYDKEDAANYENPSHYSYGSGNEYDF